MIEPVILLVLYGVFLYFVSGVMPTSDRLVAHLASLYSRYGYEILFFGALAEAWVVVNVFAPGMVALAFGGVFARTGQISLAYAILIAASGAIIGYMIDYALGYFGFSRFIEKMAGISAFSKFKERITGMDVKLFGMGFFHPNVGSVVALAAGTVKMHFVGFVLVASIATLLWFTLWGILVYELGDIVMYIMNRYLSWIGVTFTTAWVLSIVYTRHKNKGK